jgi:hypothetical protein
MIVGFTTTYAIGSYRHSYELESRSGRGEQHYVSDLQQVDGISPGVPISSTNNTDRHDMTEIFFESGVNYIITIKPNQANIDMWP